MATTHTYPQPQPGYSHVLHTPFGLWVLRGLELILAIILLGLSAYLVSQHSTSGSDLTLFTAISTIIIIFYVLITTKFYPVLYHYWAIVALELFLIIFWLVSFAKDAAEANAYLMRNFAGYVSGDDIFLYAYPYRRALISCAVFGAIQFLLVIISFFATVYYLTKHRRGGGHSMANPNPGMEMQGNTVYNNPVDFHNTAPAAVAPNSEAQGPAVHVPVKETV